MIRRPTPRELFFTKEKQLNVFFYTSNLAKFLHARVVFAQSGLVLQHFRSKEDPYAEDYSLGKEALLERAIQEISSSVGAGSLFFVEDTSLRVESLSTPTMDFPGLAVKEWFVQTSFEDFDADLRRKGNDRRAVVKSDIALHLPGLNHPVFFHGHSEGVVASSSPNFDENPQFPWLTPKSFNGWFIPDGCDKRLGEMSLEESWGYDFRTQCLEKLISRLEEYTALLNIPGPHYVRKGTAESPQQLRLSGMEIVGTALMVVGHTCAGKTTFGEYASQKHGLRFIEASSILRLIEDKLGIHDADPFLAAKKTLGSYGPDVVARKILELFQQEPDRGFVITGFRTIEEVELVRGHFPHVRVVFVEASERTRYQRHIERVRSPAVRSLEEFRKIDQEQWSFGLLRVAEEFADIKVINEGNLDEYYRKIDAIVGGTQEESVHGIARNLRPKHDAEENQLYRCLVALESSGRPLTCDEIETKTAETGQPIRHNNANKVLKRVPELARRLELEGTRVRYEILNPGRAYIRLMKANHIDVEKKFTAPQKRAVRNHK
jgi:inosine/xanthosine triphosphate pyrophosphatase family protein/dephospho-CoA kinase